ncbi:hypothetical protein GBA52_015770 [Prunus armeniaca]|nr:hypothetical protein GBA52_015770 [Prunus armeniaca]
MESFSLSQSQICLEGQALHHWATSTQMNAKMKPTHRSSSSLLRESQDTFFSQNQMEDIPTYCHCNECCCCEDH